jgi:hypothetical protein
LDCVVEPGLSFLALNKEIAQFGLWFPLDAGPNATIGGMANTNASGNYDIFGPFSNFKFIFLLERALRAKFDELMIFRN